MNHKKKIIEFEPPAPYACVLHGNWISLTVGFPDQTTRNTIKQLARTHPARRKKKQFSMASEQNIEHHREQHQNVLICE